jgi:hypothetical protein
LLTGDGFGAVFGGGFLWSTAGGACFACAAFVLAAACFFVGIAFLPLASFDFFKFMAVVNKKVGKG